MDQQIIRDGKNAILRSKSLLLGNSAKNLMASDMILMILSWSYCWKNWVKKMKIKLETRGTTYFEHQTSMMFEIDGKGYWFDMIEKGDSESKHVEVDFIPDDDLPFELTEEMKDWMYEIAFTG